MSSLFAKKKRPSTSHNPISRIHGLSLNSSNGTDGSLGAMNMKQGFSDLSSKIATGGYSKRRQATLMNLQFSGKYNNVPRFDFEEVEPRKQRHFLIKRKLKKNYSMRVQPTSRFKKDKQDSEQSKRQSNEEECFSSQLLFEKKIHNQRANRSQVTRLMSEIKKTPLPSYQSFFDLDFGQIMDKKKNSSCICRQQSKGRKLWDLLLILLVVWNLGIVITSSVDRAVDQSVTIQVLNLIVDLIFIADIIINFRTTYYDKQGDQIFIPRKIAKNYALSVGFIFDVIAALPIQWFTNSNLFMLVGLIKCIRFRRVPKWVKHLNIRVFYKIIIRSIMLFMILVIIFNVTAGGWLFLARIQADWVPPTYYLYPVSFQRNFLEESSLFEYFTSLYYMEMLLLISGDAGPVSKWQLGITVFISLIGSLINANLFAVMVTYIQQIQARKNYINDKIDIMRTTMKDIALPRPKQRIILLYVIKSESMFLQQLELRRFLRYISPSLKSEVMAELCKDIVQTSKGLIKVISSSDMSQIEFLGLLKLKLKEPEQPIFQYNDQPDNLYFIVRGQVLLTEARLRHRGFRFHKVLNKDTLFGQISLIYNTTRTLSATSTKYTTLTYMNGKQFKRLIDRQLEVKAFYNEVIFEEYNDGLRRILSKYLQNLQPFFGIKNYQIPEVVYKWKLKHFYQNSLIASPGDKLDGIMFVLYGGISFEIKVGMLSVPVAFAYPNCFVGCDHIIDGEKNLEVFIRSISYTRVLILKREDLQGQINQKFRNMRKSFSNWLKFQN